MSDDYDESIALRRRYTDYHDAIVDKRYNSPFWVRRYTHRAIHQQIVDKLVPGESVLDAGCGEGVLSCLAAGAGARVTGVDISTSNMTAAHALAESMGVDVAWAQADAAALPFGDNSFDVVASSHVLEHLPSVQEGLREIHRVTRGKALIAMPTCLTPACWALLGGDNFWHITKRTPYAILIGMARTAMAMARGDEGPNEGYSDQEGMPHVWRFPWIMRRHIESAGFRITRFEAGPIVIPYAPQYLPFLRPVQAALDRTRALPVARNLGYGSLAVCEKIEGFAG